MGRVNCAGPQEDQTLDRASSDATEGLDDTGIPANNRCEGAATEDTRERGGGSGAATATTASEGGRRGEEDAPEPATGLGKVDLVAVQGRAQESADTEWLDDVGVARAGAADTEWLDDVGVSRECARHHVSAAAADDNLGLGGVVGHQRVLHHALPRGGACSRGDDAEAYARPFSGAPVVVNTLAGDCLGVETNTDSELSEPAEQAWLVKRGSRLCGCSLLLAPLSLMGTCDFILSLAEDCCWICS